MLTYMSYHACHHKLILSSVVRMFGVGRAQLGCGLLGSIAILLS